MTHWPAHNLQELVSFLGYQHPGERGLGSAISQRLGVTPQSISAVFRKDDASLAWVEKVAAAYGFELQLIFPEIEVRGAILQKRVATMNYPNAGKLSGLVECIRRCNMTVNALSNMIKVSYHTVDKAFTDGDIKISLLKRMACALGIEIIWTWVPLT